MRKPVVEIPQWWDLQGIHSGYTGYWFLQWQKGLRASVEQAMGNHGHAHCMADPCSPCSSSFFLMISVHLRLVPPGGMNWSGPSCSVPKGLKGHSPHSPFSSKGSSSLLESSFLTLRLSNGGLRDGMSQGGWSCSSFSFCAVILRVFVFLCCWSSSCGLLRPTKAIFVCR